MTKAQNNPYIEALQWQLEQGVDEALLDEPVDRLQLVTSPVSSPTVTPIKKPHDQLTDFDAIKGTAEATLEAQNLAQAAKDLEELRQAIEMFDGLSVKKTATNMVFCDGNPEAHVMLIGEAPGADEDRQGKPFVGVSGQLLDRILACIGLSRQEEDPSKALYISNILNWRPPGNRTPSPAEIEVALPFIRRHIELIAPKILILCGGVSTKALLGKTEGISKLRGDFHDYHGIPAIATYHPAYLLRSPAQKRLVWADMLMLQQKLREMGFKDKN